MFRVRSSRLVVRLYLAGIAQLAIIVLLFVLMALFFSNPMQRMVRRHAQFVADGICARATSVDGFRNEVSRAQRMLGSDVEVLSGDRTVAGTPRSDARAPDALATCTTDAGENLTVRYWVAPDDPPPGFGLPVLAAVLAIAAGPAWLTARSIARPLSRLALAAHAFGSGNLEARARIRRSDELGEVASAFDQMADRMVVMLRAEKELLANVSHELRTPLARIRVALDLASEGAQLEGESLADIARDLGELERIVSDVLATARIMLMDGSTATVLPVRLVETNITELIAEATTRLRTRHPERRVTVSVTTPLPSIQADAVLLRRALENILDNAQKYTEDPGAEIAITAKTEGEHITIEIRDGGVGMSENDRARALEPFFRSDRSRSRATGGLGLGLALTRRIVEAHHGRVELFSELGKGTIVRIAVPLAETKAVSMATPDAEINGDIEAAP